MRSEHPENCDVMYELMFNGIVLSMIPETEIPQHELIEAGFPFCRSTVVSVAPNVSAHGVIRNLTRTTTYLAIPSKRDKNIQSCLHACICNADFSGPNIVKSSPTFIYKSAESTELHMVFNWDPVPLGVRYTANIIFYHCLK